MSAVVLSGGKVLLTGGISLSLPTAQAATPMFSEPTGTYVGSVLFSINCATPGSSLYYTSDGSTPTYPITGTTQEYTVEINDATVGTTVYKAIAVAPGFTQSAVGSATYTVTAAAGQSYPLLARWAGGGALAPSAANWQAFGQVHLNMLGLDYGGNGSSAWPYDGNTQQQTVVGLKSYANGSGKNAGPLMVLAYQDMPNLASNGDIVFPNWNTICLAAKNNWIVYAAGNSGTIIEGPYVTAVHGGSDGPNQVDPTTGLWPYQWGSQYMHDRYIGTGVLSTGNLTAGETNVSAMVAPALDGVWVDNQTTYVRVTGDWARSNDPTGYPGTQSVVTALCTGQADMGNYWHAKEVALGSNRIMLGNTSPQPAYNHGLNDTAQDGAFDLTQQQFIFGRGGDVQFLLEGFAGALGVYQRLTASARLGQAVLSGQYEVGDDQMLRHDVCFVAIFGNGYHMGGYSSTGNNTDYVDPNNTATWPQPDEYYGASLAMKGFLGAPLSGAAGAIQTAPSYGSHLYRRDFANGIVLFSDGAASITAGTYSLGGTFYALTTVNGQSINNGATYTSNPALPTFTYNCGTTDPNFTGSFTAGECIILMRSPT